MAKNGPTATVNDSTIVLVNSREKKKEKEIRAREKRCRAPIGVIMAIYRIDSAQLEPPPEQDPTPADWMDGCPHAAACRMQLERLEGPVNEDGFAWMDDLARLLGCGEDCECAE